MSACEQFIYSDLRCLTNTNTQINKLPLSSDTIYDPYTFVSMEYIRVN